MTAVADFNHLPMEHFYSLMNSHTISWGDLCMDYVAPPDLESERIAAQKEEPIRQLEYCWDYDVPELRLRKDIWENFPVCLIPQGAGPDGAERYAIVWHRKNYEEWRQEKARDFDHWLNWAEVTEHLLFKALEASKFWTVEDPIADGQIAVIRMNFVPKDEAPTVAAPKPVAPLPTVGDASDEDDEGAWLETFAKKAKAAAPKPVAAPAAKPAADGPVLNRINDITTHFPTCWDNKTRPGKGAGTRDIISVSIHNAKLRASGADRAKVERELMVALRASSAWRVIAGVSTEFCRLEMA